MPRVTAPDTKSAAVNAWDCFSPGDLATDNPLDMFGGKHIGQLELTNMQISNMFPTHTYFHVQKWYARTNVVMRDALSEDVWHAWRQATVATLYIGQRPMTMRPLPELDGELAINHVVPAAERFSVRIWTNQSALRALLDLVPPPGRPEPAPRALIWVHLEGQQVIYPPDGSY